MPLAETILALAALLAVAMVAAAVGRNLPIPYTVFLVLLGILLHGLGGAVPALAPMAELRLTPDLVLFVFLPALIFESALNLDARQLVRDLAPILALAIPALLVSTAIVGAAVWGLLGLDLVVALLFGALISATDPVAVIALFKELGAPLRLTTLIEGESLFNDATAIVLFHILVALATSGTALTWSLLPPAALEFARVFAGGALLGALFGFGVSELMRRLGASPLSILVMSLVMAYASFVVAEHFLHVSGVMAVLAAALALGVYAVTRIPQAAMRLIQEVWEVIALVCNSLLFLMIGLSVNFNALAARLPEVVLIALAVIAARAIAVYPLVPATTRLFGLPRIGVGERYIMCWGGLKGGLAVAIVLSLPETLPARQLLVELTLCVVLFTLLVNAPTIRPLIRALGIDRLTAEERAELTRGALAARDASRGVLERLRASGVVSDAARADIARRIDEIFRAAGGGGGAPGGALRRAHLEAVRAEIEELERLYAIGLIDEYIYLDLRSMLRRDRQHWAAGAGGIAASDAASVFVRVETAVLRRLREQNWAARLLARYQRLRLSQRLQRDIAGILTCQAALARIEEHPHLDAKHREPVLALYRRRLDKRRARVSAIRREFPDLYETFERRFFQRAALTSALHLLDEEHHHGELPTKAFARLERAIARALQALPRIPVAVPRLGPGELIRRVPLFSDLPAPLVAKLAAQAQTVNFLPGDEVIGEGERGSSLYVIVQGTVVVSRRRPDDGAQEHLATLTTGDFFGEAALLGDEVRTATVTAEEPVTLLRLTRRDVLALAAEESDFDRHLRSVADARRADTRRTPA